MCEQCDEIDGLMEADKIRKKHATMVVPKAELTPRLKELRQRMKAMGDEILEAREKAREAFLQAGVRAARKAAREHKKLWGEISEAIKDKLPVEFQGMDPMKDLQVTFDDEGITAIPMRELRRLEREEMRLPDNVRPIGFGQHRKPGEA